MVLASTSSRWDYTRKAFHCLVSFWEIFLRSKLSGSSLIQSTQDYQNDLYSKLSLATLLSYDYVIYTKGNNLLDILNSPYVDTYKTSSNNIHEIYDKKSQCKIQKILKRKE